MEIAVVNPQAVLQMYHCKDYPWQSLATSPLAVTADNKEKIIANADFTITSAIARRYVHIYLYENVSVLYYVWS
jgi:hypothetical protein